MCVCNCHLAATGTTLLTPETACKGYLGSIFTGVLKHWIQWTRSWIAEIFSVAAWLQVAMLCGCRRELAMCARHKALHRALVTSEHNTRATIEVVYSLSYDMPAPCAKLCSVSTDGCRNMSFGRGGRGDTRRGGRLMTTWCGVSRATGVMGTDALLF